MKIKVPDDIETFSEDDSKGEAPSEEPAKTFEDEIKEILRKNLQMSPKFVVDDVDEDRPEFKLKILLKFTELCREQIIPRHLQAANTIEARQEELRSKLMTQQQQIEHLLLTRKQLQENMKKLESAKIIAQGNHQDLSERVEEVFGKLQDKCSNKTLAEKRVAMELVDLKRRAENFKVGITDASSKMSYYTTQVQTQTDIIQKRTKPLYLDKNRQIFMKESLKDMRVNIEELVYRVKKLRKLVFKIPEVEEGK